MSQPVSPELATALRRLRLGRILDTLPERLALAQSQGLSFEEIFTLLITDEIARRDSAAVSNRVAEAKLDPDMTLERFDKSAKITFDSRCSHASRTSGEVLSPAARTSSTSGRRV